MVKSCMAPGCHNDQSDKALHFHKLPLSKPSLLKRWVANMKLKDPTLTTHSRLCSAHFTADCYETDLKAKLLGTKLKVCLKEDAVPTIFDFSGYSHTKTDITSASHSDSMQSNLREERLKRRSLKKDIGQIHAVLEKEITAKKPHSDELENLPLPEATTSVEEVVHFASVGIQADPVSFVSASTQTDESTSTEYLSHMQSTPAKQFLASQSPTSQFSDSTLCNESMETILSSSYIPSTCTSESEDIASEEDDLPSSNLINGDYEMCLVFLSHLGMLFVKCLYDPFCNAPISSTEKFYSGSMITVKSTCCKNHTHVWRSQPIVKKRPLGNLVLSAGVLYSGNTYHTLREIFNTSHVRIFSERTFYEIQDRFLFPTINRMYKIHLKELRSDYAGRSNLVLAGDGRCDSPGHSATYCTYTLMDTDTNLILSSIIIKVTESKNSCTMERDGLKRCLEDLKDAGIAVDTLATDRHPQVISLMKKEFNQIKHQFDIWHLAKSLTKKLKAASNHKDCEELTLWSRSIVNHLWWSSETCGGSVVQLKERWISILHHIVDVHEWEGSSDGSHSEYLRCGHQPFTREERKRRKWLTAESPAHQALRDIVFDKTILKSLDQVTLFCHTGDLEVVHNMMLKYMPKRISFSYRGMAARNMLAVLDNNFNVGRTQAVTATGEKRWIVRWSKASKTFVAKKVFAPKDYSFRTDLLQATIQRLEEDIASEEDAIFVPVAARQSIARKSKPSKTDVIDQHISLFPSTSARELQYVLSEELSSQDHD